MAGRAARRWESRPSSERTTSSKAFGDAVLVDEVIPSNPIEHAKRPKAALNEPGAVWTAMQLRAFLGDIRWDLLFDFYHLAAYTGARRVLTSSSMTSVSGSTT